MLFLHKLHNPEADFHNIHITAGMLNGNGIAAQRIGKVDEGIGDVIQSFCDNECFFGCNLLNCQCAAVGRGFGAAYTTY